MWALATSNKYLNEHERHKRRKKHLKAIKLSRGAVNQSCPRIPPFLNDRPKQKVIKELENEKVWYENQILLNKLTKIDKRKGRLNPNRLIDNYWRPTLTHFKVNNNRHSRKVKRENHALMKRIKSAKSLYRVKKFKKHSKKISALKQRISQNARRIKFSKKERKSKRKLLSRKSARASYQILSTNKTGKNFRNFYDTSDIAYDELDFEDLKRRAQTAKVAARVNKNVNKKIDGKKASFQHRIKTENAEVENKQENDNYDDEEF